MAACNRLLLHFPQIPLNCSYKKIINMKLKLYAAAALIILAALVSCSGSNDKEDVDKSIIPAGTDSITAQPVVPNTTNQNTVTIPPKTLPVTVVPGNSPVIPGTTTPIKLTQQPQSININSKNNTVVAAPQTITQAAPQTVTAPGMNPPHGQPNHRCDISVGAPLNSKPPAPATTQPTTVTTQQPQVTMKEIPTTIKTAPGMNPPHGEPNHRCDIAVGAPLNSKPVAPAVTTTQTVAPPALLTPAKADSSKN